MQKKKSNLRLSSKKCVLIKKKCNDEHPYLLTLLHHLTHYILPILATPLSLRSTFLYAKFVLLWIFVLMADFILEFRFEYLWPFWLLLRSVYDSFKFQGKLAVWAWHCRLAYP